MLLGQGKRAEAISEYKAALEINRDWPAALNDLAWILATDPDAALRDGSQAVDLGERACQVTGYRNPQFIGTLAAAYAEAGRFEEAVATANQAKELAARIGRTDLVERNEQLLQLYRNKTTYHEKTEH
jgi:tetratricopeptide (TPR) repeat protein